MPCHYRGAAGRLSFVAQETAMMTLANSLTLMAMDLIRFGGRLGGHRGGGLLFLLFGLLIVGVLVWALTRPHGGYPVR
jgi:hypothetical protein